MLFGIVGVITIIAICILPIIKLTVLMVVYYLLSALIQPIADERITKLLETIADTFKVLLAIVISISVMLITGLTIVINMTNTGMMYR